MYVKWYVTGKCNLRCKHCYLTDYSVVQPLDKVEDIIEYLANKGVLGIAFLGGEPLTRKDLDNIIQLVTKNNMSSKIATNGTLINNQRAKSLIDSGCKHYQISLEGHTPEYSDPVRGKGTFLKSITGAEILKKHGAWVSFAVTISKQNAKYIKKIHELARDRGVDQLKLGGFVPIGTGAKNSNEYNLTRDIVIEVRETLIELQKSYPDLQVDSKFLPNESSCSSCTFGCGAGTTNLVIKSDLSLAACDLLVEEDYTDMKINQPEDIEKIWNEHHIFRKWRGQAPKEYTNTIGSFENVHKMGCHVAYSTYTEDLFKS